MILADENIDYRIIRELRGNAISVFSIYENHRGIMDEEVIQLSKNPPRIILTEDKDFGEWVFSHKEEDISVILLRYSFSETKSIIKILIELLKSKEEKLFNCFTTITNKKIRIRSL